MSLADVCYISSELENENKMTTETWNVTLSSFSSFLKNSVVAEYQKS